MPQAILRSLLAYTNLIRISIIESAKDCPQQKTQPRTGTDKHETTET